MSDEELFRALLAEAGRTPSQGLAALDGIAIPHPKAKAVICRVGLRVSLKFPDGDTLEKRHAALRLFELFYDRFRGELTHYQRVRTKTPIPEGFVPRFARPEAFEDLEDHCGGTLYGFKGMDYAHDVPLYYTRITCNWNQEPGENSDFEAHLPASWCVRVGFDEVRETVRSWASILKAAHGTAGLSLLFISGGGKNYLKYAYALLRKFPGLDYEDEARFSAQVNSPNSGGVKPFKIRTSSWLTVLGEPIIAELGGRDRMRAELGPDCPLFDYDGGTLIQAMPVPLLGNAELGDFPEGYRRVARLTKPVRFEAYSRSLFENLPAPLDDRQETLDWLRRFD